MVKPEQGEGRRELQRQSPGEAHRGRAGAAQGALLALCLPGHQGCGTEQERWGSLEAI